MPYLSFLEESGVVGDALAQGGAKRREKRGAELRGRTSTGSRRKGGKGSVWRDLNDG